MRIQGRFDPIVQTVPIWNTLLKIEAGLGFGLKQMAGYMGLDVREYGKLRALKKDPPLDSIFHLCEQLYFDFHSFMTGQLDYRALVQQFCGNTLYLPERYAIAAYTKNRIPLAILDFIETKFDWRTRYHALKALQISEAAIEDPEGMVNLSLTVDLIEWFYQHCQSPDLVRELGRSVLLSKVNSDMVEELRSSRTIYELFEQILEGRIAKHLERNFLWRLQKLTATEVVVRGMPHPEVRASLGRNYVENEATFHYRSGILSAFPEILGFPSAPARVTDFFSGGRSYCELTLNIESLARRKDVPRFKLIEMV